MAKHHRPSRSAIDVANYLLSRAAKDGRYLTPMSLQKMLYFAQCWSLAENDGMLFSEDIEAWTFGPVVPLVWKAYSGKRPIMPEKPYFEPLDDEEREIVDSVWLVYRDYSPLKLSKMTHAEEAWKTARGNLNDSQPSKSKLRPSLMKASAQRKLQSNNDWIKQNIDELISQATPL